MKSSNIAGLKTLFLLMIVFLFIGGCAEPADPIVGNWKLTSMYKNDTLITLDDCVRQTTLHVLSNNQVKRNNFYIDTTNNCVEYHAVEKWSAKGNKVYVVDTGSRIDQKNRMILLHNKLIYSFEALDFIHTPTSMTLQVTPIRMIYSKY